MTGAPSSPPPSGDGELLVDQVAGLRRLAELQQHPRLRKRWLRVVAFLALFITPVALAIVSVKVFPNQPTEQLLTADPVPAGEPGVRVSITLRRLDADAGELLGDATFLPTDAIATRGVLEVPVTMRLNDAGGESLLTFDPDDIMVPTEVRFRFSGSRATQYPFDSYAAILLVGGAYGPPEQAVPLRVSLDLTAAFTQYTASAEAQSSVLAGGAAARVRVERSLGVITWAVMFMAIAWSLGLACLALTWSSLTHFDVIPFWHWGLFASVLFALPNIRNALPGSPPFGSTVDWGAYYWAVVMTASALLILVTTWLVTARRGTARM